ncbi:Endoglucanase [Arachis hypogaea]|nr:Endoglucanase [Arachis hypogaea]
MEEKVAKKKKNKNVGALCWWLTVSMIGMVVVGAGVLLLLKKLRHHASPQTLSTFPTNIVQKYASALELCLQFFDVQKCNQIHRASYYTVHSPLLLTLFVTVRTPIKLELLWIQYLCNTLATSSSEHGSSDGEWWRETATVAAAMAPAETLPSPSSFLSLSLPPSLPPAMASPSSIGTVPPSSLLRSQSHIIFSASYFSFLHS